MSVWPKFDAPPRFEDPVEGWEDPALPDFGAIFATARTCGYSVGLHGSMKRDVDLIAAPWTEEATDAETLIRAIAETLNARVMVDPPERKPHGRIGVTMQIDGWFKPIDLSVMPRAAQPPHTGATP